MATQLNYTRNTANAADIEQHLVRVNANFIPPLDTRVNLNAYALKLADKAVTFEAWDDRQLAGLIAAYMNTEGGFAFITSVSVLTEYLGRQVAAQLLQNCMHYVKRQQFTNIQLEVNKNNLAAIHFYKKYNFTQHDENEESLFLSCLIP